MRVLSCFVMILCLAGCSKNNQPIVLAVIEVTDYTPFLAWFASSESTPTPVDGSVSVGDTCPICKGTGKNSTDGTMIKTCKDCKGDGRVDEGDPILGTTELPMERSVLRTYYVEYQGYTYVWDGNKFSCEGRQPIIPQGQLDIRRAKSIQLCQGTFCLVIPIQVR